MKDGKKTNQMPLMEVVEQRLIKDYARIGEQFMNMCMDLGCPNDTNMLDWARCRILGSSDAPAKEMMTVDNLDPTAYARAAGVMGTTLAEYGGPTDDVLKRAIVAYLGGKPWPDYVALTNERENPHNDRVSQIAIIVKDFIETLMLWNGQASAGLDVNGLAGLRDELNDLAGKGA